MLCLFVSIEISQLYCFNITLVTEIPDTPVLILDDHVHYPFMLPDTLTGHRNIGNLYVSICCVSINDPTVFPGTHTCNRNISSDK